VTVSRGERAVLRARHAAEWQATYRAPDGTRIRSRAILRKRHAAERAALKPREN
jgi:hypothetical protein